MILTKPSKFKSQVWKGVCHNCEAEYESIRKDLQENIEYPSGIAGVLGEVFIDCPECMTTKGLRFGYSHLIGSPTTEEG